MATSWETDMERMRRQNAERERNQQDFHRGGGSTTQSGAGRLPGAGSIGAGQSSSHSHGQQYGARPGMSTSHSTPTAQYRDDRQTLTAQYRTPSDRDDRQTTELRPPQADVHRVGDSTRPSGAIRPPGSGSTPGAGHDSGGWYGNRPGLSSTQSAASATTSRGSDWTERQDRPTELPDIRPHRTPSYGSATAGSPHLQMSGLGSPTSAAPSMAHQGRFGSSSTTPGTTPGSSDRSSISTRASSLFEHESVSYSAQTALPGANDVTYRQHGSAWSSQGGHHRGPSSDSATSGQSGSTSGTGASHPSSGKGDGGGDSVTPSGGTGGSGGNWGNWASNGIGAAFRIAVRWNVWNAHTNQPNFRQEVEQRVRNQAYPGTQVATITGPAHRGGRRGDPNAAPGYHVTAHYTGAQGLHLSTRHIDCEGIPPN